MTAVITRPPAGAEVIEEARARAVAIAWDVYRQSQGLPFTGDLLKAQSALFALLEPHTRTLGKPQDAPDVAAIFLATEDLFAAIGENEMAAAAAGDGGE
jgi:hypothetical protein